MPRQKQRGIASRNDLDFERRAAILEIKIIPWFNAISMLFSSSFKGESNQLHNSLFSLHVWRRFDFVAFSRFDKGFLIRISCFVVTIKVSPKWWPVKILLNIILFSRAIRHS